MKKLFSNYRIYVMVILAAMFFSFTVNDKPSFSGEWKLDEAKSELGDFGNFVARSLKVDQKDNAIAITRTTPGFNGGTPSTTTLTLSYDGKVTDSEGFGGSKRKSTAKWSDDGQTLIINNTIIFERDGQTNEFKSTESWTLTKEGTISIATHSSSPRGETDTKAIYIK
jgi:hypothetical protein